MTNRTPIAIFAYKRADHLKRLADSLERCIGFGNEPVTIFIDGPKAEADVTAVEEVRAVATALDWPRLEIVAGAKNQGLRKSIYAGVSSIVQQHGRVIVLEDDLLLAPSALTYFSRGLEAYADVDSVYAISGYVYPTAEFVDRHSTLILPFAHSWGWATWERAWNGFSAENTNFLELSRSRSFRRAFGAHGIAATNTMLDLQLQGQIDSWLVLWNAYITLNRGVSVFPPRTVVKNAGLSSAGATHSSVFNFPARLRSRSEHAAPYLEDAEALVFSDASKTDFLASDAAGHSSSASLARLAAHLGAARRKLRALISRK